MIDAIDDTLAPPLGDFTATSRLITISGLDRSDSHQRQPRRAAGRAAEAVLTLRRSILTEKVARRGYHLSCEYAVDPLEILFVREVMRTSIVALPAGSPFDTIVPSLKSTLPHARQRLYPVVDDDRRLQGVVTRGDLQQLVDLAPNDAGAQLAMIMRRSPAVAYPDEPLRVVVYHMAESGLTRFPVVERGSMRVVGMISLTDLLKARTVNLEAERRRERVLKVHIAVPFRNPRSFLQA